MLGLPPLTPKQAAQSILTDHVSRAITSSQQANYADAAQATAQVIAVAAAYTVGTLASFGGKYAISGLDSAIRALSKNPSMLGSALLKMGLISDPLVAQRLGNVGKAFSGGAAAAYLVNEAINWANLQNIGSGIYDLLHPKNNSSQIDPKIKNNYDAAQNWQPRRDPLILDLDGNGLDTIAASPTKPILFDHNGDGTKTGTGWIGANDGFLVVDRNDNGTIDNGTELFGDSTDLYSGGKAEDGFAALNKGLPMYYPTICFSHP